MREKDVLIDTIESAVKLHAFTIPIPAIGGILVAVGVQCAKFSGMSFEQTVKAVGEIWQNPASKLFTGYSKTDGGFLRVCFKIRANDND